MRRATKMQAARNRASFTIKDNQRPQTRERSLREVIALCLEQGSS